MAPETKPNISFEDFSKLDLRVGKVIAAARVPETDKLIQFQLDFGPFGERTIIGGWAESYSDPEQLVGKLLPAILNLEPRTIRGIESQGMLLGGSKDGKPIALLPDQAVEPGSEVR